MFKIRKKVFETNSSSTHSITLSKEAGVICDFDLVNGELVIEGRSFGWEWEKYNDFKTKLSYAAISCQYADDKFKSLLIQLLKDITCANNVVFPNLNDFYIDHESIYTCPDNYNDLKLFLFDDKSWLFLGNDNGYPPYDFYHKADKYKYKIYLEEFPDVFELAVEKPEQNHINQFNKHLDLTVLKSETAYKALTRYNNYLNINLDDDNLEKVTYSGSCNFYVDNVPDNQLLLVRRDFFETQAKHLLESFSKEQLRAMALDEIHKEYAKVILKEENHIILHVKVEKID